MERIKPIYLKCLPIFLLAVAACQGSKPKQEKTPEKTQIVGNDVDAHGCKASAGYQWSALLNECIRPFEAGMKLMPLQEQGSMKMATFAVFNSDSSKVELFVPNNKPVVLEKRMRPNNTPVWNQEDDDTYQLEMKNKKWIVSKRMQELYSN